MPKRFGFGIRAMREGLKWARDALGLVVFLLGLAAIVAGVTVAGVLLQSPAWVITVVVIGVVATAFFEGTYRMWRDSQRLLALANGAVADTNSISAVANRMENFAAEFAMLGDGNRSTPLFFVKDLFSIFL